MVDSWFAQRTATRQPEAEVIASVSAAAASDFLGQLLAPGRARLARAGDCPSLQLDFDEVPSGGVEGVQVIGCPDAFESTAKAGGQRSTGVGTVKARERRRAELRERAYELVSAWSG